MFFEDTSILIFLPMASSIFFHLLNTYHSDCNGTVNGKHIFFQNKNKYAANKISHCADQYFLHNALHSAQSGQIHNFLNEAKS